LVEQAGSTNRRKLPDWLRVKAPVGEGYQELKKLVTSHSLHTVCESARCPNIGECWNSRTATFMLLGDVCTRSCGFCAVRTGRPAPLDLAEPRKVAEAVERLGLRYAVITSVTRDDLEMGGAEIFAATIYEIRQRRPSCQVEVLIPDFKGNWEALALVIEARPDVLNHNLETVPRLYRRVRPQAKYDRSIELLRRAKELADGLLTKSGLIVGLGETSDEVEAVMRDLVQVGLDILTIGQYLRPSLDHLPVEKFYSPEEFRAFREMGESLGIPHVESAPLVRSSYHAREQSAACRSEARRHLMIEG